MDRKAWHAAVHGVAKSQTRPSNFQFHFHFHSSASVLGVLQFSSVQLLSCVRLFCNTMDYNTPGFPVHHQLPELAQTHVYLVSDAIQPSHSLSSPTPPTFNLSQHQGLFHSAALRIRWPKYWNFSFNISAYNEHPGLISFRMDWLDLLDVQGTLKSSPTPQFKSINSSALSFLYSPTLTSIHDYWKKHSFD